MLEDREERVSHMVTGSARMGEMGCQRAPSAGPMGRELALNFFCAGAAGLTIVHAAFDAGTERRCHSGSRGAVS